MRIGVPKESQARENRVAATPETVKKFTALGAQVFVEHSAGLASGFLDPDYINAGAILVSHPHAFDADIVLTVQRPTRENYAHIKPSSILVGLLDPFAAEEDWAAFAQTGVTSFAMELLPRISRAQTMDVLSSQANLVGYRAVIDAAAEYNRAVPMMMTAAGAVPAARVFVMGAGVAGLQAIATARRLGAIVTATDVRPAAKEQVQSLGAKFIAVEDEEFKQAETSGGYARDMSEAYKVKQAALIAEHIAKQDIVITTALIPGRAAPQLVSAEMVASMRPGSVIVDLAVERDGNCALSRIDSTYVSDNGVRIVGSCHVGKLASTASSLYARNLFAFAEILIDKTHRIVTIPEDDVLVKATLRTRGGAVLSSQGVTI